MNKHVAPGSTGTYIVTITDSVDVSLDGTIAMATIMALDGNGLPVGGGACAVAVEP